MRLTKLIFNSISIKISMAIFLTLVVYFCAFIYIRDSDAARAGIVYIKESREISRKIGIYNEIKLYFFPIKIKVSGASGDAQLKYKISRDGKESHYVVVSLRKNLGQWNVTGAALDGLPLIEQN